MAEDTTSELTPETSRTSKDFKTYYFNHLEQHELKCHQEISEKNFNAIGKLQQEVVTSLPLLFDFDVLDLNLKAGKMVMKEHCELKQKVEQSENDTEKVKRRYLEIQENIKKLNKEIEKNSGEEAKMKNYITETQLDYKQTVAAYKKAWSYYKTYLGLDIDIDSDSSGNTFSGRVKFNEHSKNYVKFTFDREKNKIIGFDASSFVNQKKHEILQQFFKETGDMCALVCALRSLALR